MIDAIYKAHQPVYFFASNCQNTGSVCCLVLCNSKKKFLKHRNTKMNFSLVITILLLFILLLNGCEDNLVDSLTDNSFYPLSLGNKWTYNSIQYDSTGAIISQGGFTEHLPAQYIWDKRFIYEFNTPFWFVHNDMLYVQNKLYGLYLVLASPGGRYFGEDYLKYKYPVVKGEYYLNGEFIKDTTYVISTDTIVDCEAGIFKSIVYKNNMLDLVDYPIIRYRGYSLDYVTYGTGKVKKEYYFINSDGQHYKDFEYSLKSYEFY